uniref:Dynamin GTPase n=1 Tax=Mucochytrium quahogii TaxID=96639 RepID=A0A7S2S2X6_9STRA|mmetsp:Transcript_19924/g.32798  ORF Transcript_19924/g.32798 Transcript_19924/m.32798 type:complete len:737 (+) Transcript_19924:300-2510(+)
MMDGLIPVINKLQDVFNTIGQRKPPLNLPQIVVVGSQSSGKSSVLENIVGKGFLPRGSGICTRRPLVLQLYYSPGATEWAEFLHIPNRKFTDFDQVRHEIEMETERETGTNKGVSNKAIRLKVFSPNVLTLTLVDLPGITKVPIGDQPGNIEELIRDMCLEYVSNPLSIILAVSPANADLANSDALKLARQVDPAGERTIGILTKLDLVDEGVDALDALNGKIIPLKGGYIGVVNRSQAEINANTSIQEVRKKEKAFFVNHPSYRGIASRQGTEHLTQTLNTILLSHIREHLPELKANVQKQLREVDRELAALGSEATDMRDKTAQGQLILSLVSKYSTNFVDSMEGRQTNVSSRAHVSTPNGGLFGGARLARSFRSFSDNLVKVSPFVDLTDNDIGTAIMNATGPRASLFVPELSFEVLVKRQLTHFQEPALSCVMEVFEVLHEVADQSSFPGLSRFVALQEKISESVNKMLYDALRPTQGMIENLIRIEQAFINTSHPDFVNRLETIRSRPLGDLTSLGGHDHAASEYIGTQAIKNIDSAASTVSANSDSGFDQRRKTHSLDVDLGGYSDQLASASDEEEDTSRKTPNFMSFIFNERVSTNGNMNGGVSKQRVSAFTAAASVLQQQQQQQSYSDNEEKAQIRIIKRLIDSYLQISRKNILDLTPKTIMFFLVNHVKENLHTELIQTLYKQELFDELLREDEQVAAKRENLKETSQLLHKALSILNEVREYKLLH